MKTPLLMDFNVDKQNNTIHVKRQFDAPISLVWPAWTTSELLDQWWAPKPWKARTKTMDFREGGHWLYAMVGPEGEQHWARIDYRLINPARQFVFDDAFCDESGNLSNELPNSNWTVDFSKGEDATLVSIHIRYATLADLEKYIELGFREGFTMALENLDELLQNS